MTTRATKPPRCGVSHGGARPRTEYGRILLQTRATIRFGLADRLDPRCRRTWDNGISLPGLHLRSDLRSLPRIFLSPCPPPVSFCGYHRHHRHSAPPGTTEPGGVSPLLCTGVSSLYCAYTKCVHQIEMSLFLPFRNVTVVGVGRRAGAEPRRSAAPDRRPTHGRLQPHRLSTERASARSARRRTRADRQAPVASVAAVAARWINRQQLVEVDLGDGLQLLGRRGSLQVFR